MKGILPLFLLTTIAPAQEIVISRQSGDARKSDLAYFKNSEITFSGRVTGKLKSDGTSTPAPVRIIVKSSNGGTSSVDLGPTWFLRDQASSINVGDRITVTGSKYKQGNQFVVNARLVRKGAARLVLRDSAGFPYWVASRQAPVEPATGGISGRIARMQTVRINNQLFNGAFLTTPNGEELVVFAPDWYYNEQAINLTPGTFIRTYGANYGGAFSMTGGLSQPAPGLFVVGGMYTPTGFFNFTNPSGYVYGNFPGFPPFNGF